MCSLASMMIRRYMASTVESRLSLLTFFSRCDGGCTRWAFFTASSDRLSQAITSGFDVTVCSAFAFSSGGIGGPVMLKRRKIRHCDVHVYFAHRPHPGSPLPLSDVCQRIISAWEWVSSTYIPK